MDALDDLRIEISEAAGASDDERVTLLESIRTDLTAMLSEVDTALAEVAIDPDTPRPVSVEFAIAAMRARAEAVQEVLDDDLITEAELTEAGIFTVAELDYLASENLLETAAQELIEAGRITEAGDWTDVTSDDPEPAVA